MATGHPEPAPKPGFNRSQHKSRRLYPNYCRGPMELPVICRCTVNSELEFHVRHELDINILQTDGNFGTINASNYKPEFQQQPDQVNQQELVLLPEEVMFLSFGVHCLTIQNEATGEELSFNQVWKLLVQKNLEFPLLYTVYHYLRSKNWAPKVGTQYGGDYVLYKVGRSFFHTIYVVHLDGLPSRTRLNWGEAHMLQDLASSTRKHALVCEVNPPDNFSAENSDPSCIFWIKVKETVISRCCWKPEGNSEIDEILENSDTDDMDEGEQEQNLISHMQKCELNPDVEMEME